MILIDLDEKDREIIAWGLGQIVNYPDRAPEGPGDPLFVLLDMNYPRAVIMPTAEAMFELAYGWTLTDALTALERDILRVCVENSSWVTAYIECGPTADDPSAAAASRGHLRSLAAKLDQLGIEINFMPNN